MIVNLAVEARGSRARGPVRQKLNDSAAAVLTGEKPAVGRKCDAVNAIRVLAVIADAAGARIKAADKAFVEHTEEHLLARPCESAHAALVGSGDSFEIPA